MRTRSRAAVTGRLQATPGSQLNRLGQRHIRHADIPRARVGGMRHPGSAMTPPDVHVLILGPVLVRRGAHTVTPSAPLTRTIIGVLALAGWAGLSVDALAESAWP